MKLKDVIPNPDNPRLIKDENYQKLYNSITQSPTFMKLNPLKLDENLMILGGNMRYKICKELGWLEVPTVIFTKKDAEENNKARKGQDIEEATYLEQCREYIIKDNVSYGYNDWDIIKSDWKAESENDKFNEWALDDFPFEVETVDYSDKNKELNLNDFEDQKYTIKLEFTEDDYTLVKDKLEQLKQSPEKILYDALISL
tara:strand:+ start:696 stop:1295 length:600 start_codon:yes stop_codon:yes gene_type:complete